MKNRTFSFFCIFLILVVIVVLGVFNFYANEITEFIVSVVSTLSPLYKEVTRNFVIGTLAVIVVFGVMHIITKNKQKN